MINGVDLNFPCAIIVAYFTGFKLHGNGKLLQGTMRNCLMDFRDSTLSIRIRNVFPFATKAANSDHTAFEMTIYEGYICSREGKLVFNEFEGLSGGIAN